MRELSMAGVILAGGRSNRMGGEPKALIRLDGRPMLDHVIGRFRPQVDRLLLSVERVEPRWARFGLEQVADPEPGFNGPLGGLSAALDAVAQEADWLALAPCDAPFLPRDLARRLQRAAGAAEAVVVRLAGRLQPTFSLWRCDLAGRLREAVVRDGLGGFREFLERVDWAAADWPKGAGDAFFNINDRAALATARRRLAATEEEPTC